LVTGAARGIGLAVTEALLRSGHRVVMVDRRRFAAAELLGEDHLDAVQAASLDVTDPASVRRLEDSVRDDWRPVSVLVCNAGISPKLPSGRSAGLLEISAEEWHRVLDVNLTAVMRLCQVFLPGMQELGWGRVVNMASLAGRTASAVAGPSYMASKAGLIGLTRAIAAEFGPAGITANCVAPGRILTEMAAQAGEEVNRRYAERIPVRRIGTPAEVAACVAFLASEEAGFVNGAIIDVNGGSFMP
jgi:3-oxoacyl-[acyl-carrier protein] reductase